MRCFSSESASENIRGYMMPGLNALLCIVLSAGLFSCRPPTFKPDYTAFNQGELALEAVVTPVWKKQLTNHRFSPNNPEELTGAEVSDDGRTVWIGSNDRVLWAFSTVNGKPRWKKQFKAAILAPPLYVSARGFLFVGVADGCLYCLEAESGKERWKYCAQGLIYRRPAYRHGVVYFTNTQNYLYAIDGETGKWRWSYERTLPEGFGIRDHAGIAIDGERIYTGFKDGYVVCLDARTGDVIWTRNLQEKAKDYMDLDSTPLVHDGVVYVASQAGGVYALTADMGTLKWHYPVSSPSGIALSDDRIYFVSSRKGIHCLTTEGKLVWRQELDGGAAGTPVVYRDLLIFNTSEKGTFFVDKKTGGYVQRIDFGFGASGQLALYGDSLYLLDNFGTFHAMRLF